MISQIAPVLFTRDIPRTVKYYAEKLGFKCLGLWPGDEDPSYAIVARDGRAIHFRCAAPPAAQADKYEEELLDAYLFVEDADALFAEYAGKGVEFARGLGDMPWRCREFVVKDCDGRLLAFGANI
ncbi:MAG TPA: VOC family protein [Terracidiphilus sp.]